MLANPNTTDVPLSVLQEADERGPVSDHNEGEKVPHIQVSEIYDKPTYQGEGIDIGRPCFFVRLQHCPVRCPSCDSFYTWDGTEKGEKTALAKIDSTITSQLEVWPGCGLVLTGGEPLIHYKNQDFSSLLIGLKKKVAFLSIETSGYVGKIANVRPTEMLQFLHLFDTIHLSPKITPCLHGLQSNEEALATQIIFETITPRSLHPRLVYKFVARDDADIAVVLKYNQVHRWLESGYPVYLMPYGIHRDEILATCEKLLPACAKHGFILSPRLHSILWGSKRGV